MRVTCLMCRTNGALNQVSTIANILEFGCSRCGLILEIQVYITDNNNNNRGRVDCQMLDKVGKVINKTDVAVFDPGLYMMTSMKITDEPCI